MNRRVLVVGPAPETAAATLAALRHAGLKPEFATPDPSHFAQALNPIPATLVAHCPLGASTADFFNGLRERFSGDGPRSLALTPSGDSRAVLEALAGGADWFLQAPYQPDLLVATVRDLLHGEHAALSRLARQRRQVLDLLLSTAALLDENRALLSYAREALIEPAPADGAVQRAEVLPIPALMAELLSVSERSMLRSREFQALLELERRRSGELKAAIDELTLTRKQSLLYARDLRDAVVAERERAEELARALSDLEESYDATIYALATALDTRDNATEGHSRRVTAYTVAVARVMGVPDDEILHLERGAYLHDLGKIGVPDAILHKPGLLTDDEWRIMKSHPELGHQMIVGVGFLTPASPVVRYHHERWDGKGYSAGLSGPAIPIGARVFCIADTFDAITADRPYREGQPPEAARAEIVRGQGSQYDPAAVEAFLRVYEDGDLFRTSGATAAVTLRALRQSA